MALSFADRDDIVASQGEHGSHFGTPDQDEWYAKYIDYMIEEGYLEPGDEKISKSYAMGALTYGEAAYAADRVSKGLSAPECNLKINIKGNAEGRMVAVL